MTYICALIVVEDIKRSRFFYESLLQQNVKLDFGENITFHGDFAIHQRSHFQELIRHPVNRGRHNSCELYFEHNDLEDLHETLKQEGIHLLHPPVEQPWRQRVMRFYDYDENLIEVGESMEHVALRLSREGLKTEEISRITYLSESVVDKITGDIR